MKKRILLCLLVVLGLLVACNSKSKVTDEMDVKDVKDAGDDGTGKYEMALVTAHGFIEGTSTYDNALLDGIKKYAENNGIAYKYYIPENKSSSAYEVVISDAVNGGAKMVFCHGKDYEVPVYYAQAEYEKSTNFILFDGKPHNDDDSMHEMFLNMQVAEFKDDEKASFLAGYAAVKDGYTKFGFIGEKEGLEAARVGFGFIQGIEAAAAEDDIKCEIHYKYLTGNDIQEALDLAKEWYDEGTEIILGSNILTTEAIIKAADSKESSSTAKVIGFDIDFKEKSDKVVISVIRDFGKVIANNMDNYKQTGGIYGGRVMQYGIADGAIGLAMDSSRFSTFSMNDYDEACQSMINNKWQIVDIVGEISPIKAGIALHNTKVIVD